MDRAGSLSSSLLVLALAAAGAGPRAARPQEPSLPSEVRGAKIYRLPEEGKPGAVPDDPVIYRNLAYEDINLERLVLKLSLAIKPVDRAATIQKIYFQDIRVNGIPVQLEPFDQEFKLSRTQAVDLPAPLTCTILFADLDSLAPLKEIVNQDRVTVTGRSFLEVKLSGLQKLVVRAKRLVLPVDVKQEVPLQMFADNSFAKMAASSILDTLTDPAGTTAIALAKAHLARLTGERALEQKSRSSLYLLYCEYAVRDPKSGATEKFWQSGTGFIISPEGVLLTAKRVVEPWKFDPQTALLISHDHLEIEPKSVRLAAWPAGAAIRSDSGNPDWGTAIATDQQGLRVVRLAPDRFEKEILSDPDSGARAEVSVHRGGEDDIAVLQITGEKFQPLELAGPEEKMASAGGLTLLGFPFALSQAETVPQSVSVSASMQGGLIRLNHALNPGQAGGPLVNDQGKVLALCTEPDQCVPVELLRKLIP